MWEALNTTEVGPFFFPLTDEECGAFAAESEVGVRSLQQQPVTAAVFYGVNMQAVRKRMEYIELFSEGRPAYFFVRNLGFGVLV